MIERDSTVEDCSKSIVEVSNSEVKNTFRKLYSVWRTIKS